jgi:TonB family protein
MQATTFGLPVSTPATQTTAEGTEDLGMSIMEGLSVHGQRSSKTMVLKPPTIERETIGNGTEITVTNEAWYSDQLQMNVLTKTHVTGNPTRTLTVTKVSLNEPDATLFQIPSAYTQTNVQQAVRIGGKIAEANLITHVDPTYPSLAKAARVQGVVEFTATIGPDGIIKNLQLVRGHPLLVNAAKEAVLQWRYRPTFLNGEAISVTTPVIVSFTLPDQN